MEKKQYIPKEQYIKDAIRTESVSQIDITLAESRMLHAAMGMSTEANEILDVMKKLLFYHKEVDRVNLIEEVGDLMWYVAIMCDALDISMAEVMVKNIIKLMSRYPEKFDANLAVNRDLNAERAVLEGIERCSHELPPVFSLEKRSWVCDGCGEIVVKQTEILRASVFAAGFASTIRKEISEYKLTAAELKKRVESVLQSHDDME